MSSWSVYLIPTKYKGTSREFAIQAESLLAELRVIDGYYDDRPGWFTAGENSDLMFTNRNTCKPAFECAIIYGSEAYRIVPDSGLHGFTCSRCANRIDAEVRNAINSFYDAEGDGPKRDMRFIRIQCSACGFEEALERIPCTLEVAMVNKYINFLEYDGVVDSSKVLQLQGRISSPIRLIYERF
jgi:hypothetical protein